MQPSDWSVVDTDDEPWALIPERWAEVQEMTRAKLAGRPIGAYSEYDPWRVRRRLSLRVLILCGAALVTIAAIAWVTR